MIDEHSDARRFWVRVKQNPSGCWLWVGGTRENGYGTFAIKSTEGRWTQTTAHRFAYQNQVAEIPDSFEVDHLCRVRNCVRPDHLEAVTVAENRRRRDEKIIFNVPTYQIDLPILPAKTVKPPKPDRTNFCPNGHEYAVVGKVVNGFGRSGERRFTCAECRRLKVSEKRNNNAAKDRQFCPQGHPYSGENLITRNKIKNGRLYVGRECKTCTYERNRQANHKRSVCRIADAAVRRG